MARFAKTGDENAGIPNPSDVIDTSNQDWVDQIAEGQRPAVKEGTGPYKTDKE